jgi:hypothetical protein
LIAQINDLPLLVAEQRSYAFQDLFSSNDFAGRWLLVGHPIEGIRMPGHSADVAYLSPLGPHARHQFVACHGDQEPDKLVDVFELELAVGGPHEKICQHGLADVERVEGSVDLAAVDSQPDLATNQGLEAIDQFLGRLIVASPNSSNEIGESGFRSPTRRINRFCWKFSVHGRAFPKRMALLRRSCPRRFLAQVYHGRGQAAYTPWVSANAEAPSYRSVANEVANVISSEAMPPSA